jgi:hypothetical protein
MDCAITLLGLLGLFSPSARKHPEISSGIQKPCPLSRIATIASHSVRSLPVRSNGAPPAVMHGETSAHETRSVASL